MIAFPGMLLEPARRAGMKVPEDPDNFNEQEFPHFTVFLNVQLGSPMPYPSAHWDNAKVIAAIPDEKIRTIEWGEIRDDLAIGYTKP